MTNSTWWLTAINNFSLRESKAIFWLPWAAGMYMVHIHTFMQNSCAYKIKYIKLNKTKSCLISRLTSKFYKLLPSVWNRRESQERQGSSNISLCLYFPDSLTVYYLFMFHTFFCFIFNENDNFIRTRKNYF